MVLVEPYVLNIATSDRVSTTATAVDMLKGVCIDVVSFTLSDVILIIVKHEYTCILSESERVIIIGKINPTKLLCAVLGTSVRCHAVIAESVLEDFDEAAIHVEQRALLTYKDIVLH